MPAGVFIIVGLLRHLSQTAYTSPTRVRSMSATASGAGKLAGDEDVPGDSAMAIWWTLNEHSASRRSRRAISTSGFGTA